MSKMLEPLDDSVLAFLRSAANIDSVTQCVTELVLNSLDAKSSAIVVRVDLSIFRVQVVDNGIGISYKNLEFVGGRYMTNKCHKIDDLQRRLNFFGFRGEALANIIKISNCVSITSKERNAKETYCKKFEREKSRIDRIQDRSSCGTTVAIEGFLNNLPIRQQCVKNSEIDTLKRTLESLIIMHPQVSFSLRNDATGKIILNCQKSSDIKISFCNLHQDIDSTNFAFFKVTKNRTTVKALIYKNTSENKRLQYVYVNKRPIWEPKIQHLVNSLFKLSKIAENAKKWPIFIIHIKCPYSDVELNSTPDKTLVFFKKFDIVKCCINKLLSAYFGADDSKTKNEKIRPQQTVIGPSQINGAVKELKNKRKNDNILDDHISLEKMMKVGKIDERNFISSVKSPKSVEHVFTKVSTSSSKDEDKDIHLLKTQKNNITCNTLFTEFPENEDKGKHVIMNMFLKSMTVYPSQCNLTADNIKEVISVGIQTSPIWLNSNSFPVLQPKLVEDCDVKNNSNNALFDSNVELDLFAAPFKQKIDFFSSKTGLEVLKKSSLFPTESPFFNKKKFKIQKSKKELDISTVSKYFSSKTASGFFLDVDQKNANNKEVDFSKDLFSQSKISPSILNFEKVNRPKDFSFELMDRLDCVPKGLSPLLKGVDVDEMSLEGKENLQNAVIEEFNDELLLIKWQNYIDHKDPKKFFEEIYLEKSKALHGVVPCATKKHIQFISFSKDFFKNLAVIGQVDKKFIVAFDTLKDLILLFDQHAVHERVRLEKLMNDYQNTATSIQENLSIFLSHSNINLLKQYRDGVTALGIGFSFFSNGINIYEVPLCIYNKSKKKGNILELTKTLINEVIGILTDNKGLMVHTPDTLLNIIKSEACRGAVKFGDFLTNAECSVHLNHLSNCHLPFQCAHGRPTLTPLMFLTNLPDLSVPKPNLKKLQYFNR